MRIQVIGNCQARPLAALIEAATGFAAEPAIILHLAKPEEAEAHRQVLAEADLILAQRTDPAFPVAHLRSGALKEAWPNTVTVWPNVFYGGEQPYLRYVTHARQGRVLGPMTEYHDLRVLRAWFADRRGIDFLPECTAPDFVSGYAEKALKTLQSRETDCDVTSADLIAAQGMPGTGPHLFWTFNHPTLWLLTQLCNRILDHVGLPQASLEGMREPLNRIQPPLGAADLIEAGEPYQGVEVDLSLPGTVTLGAVRRYSAKDLRDSAFACYDHQAEMLDPAHLRVTPA